MFNTYSMNPISSMIRKSIAKLNSWCPDSPSHPKIKAHTSQTYAQGLVAYYSMLLIILYVFINVFLYGEVSLVLLFFVYTHIITYFILVSALPDKENRSGYYQ